MNRIQMPALLALFLAACSPPSEGGAQKSNPGSKTAKASPTTPTFYVHCVGRDIHLRNYQPPIALSYQINGSNPSDMQEFYPDFKTYFPMCLKINSKCEGIINANVINLSAIVGNSENIQLSTFLNIDRISGEFRASKYDISEGKEYTRYEAVGQCQKSSSSIPNIAI